jgi:hypothetical protein
MSVMPPKLVDWVVETLLKVIYNKYIRNNNQLKIKVPTTTFNLWTLNNDNKLPATL